MAESALRAPQSLAAAFASILSCSDLGMFVQDTSARASREARGNIANVCPLPLPDHGAGRDIKETQPSKRIRSKYGHNKCSQTFLFHSLIVTIELEYLNKGLKRRLGFNGSAFCSLPCLRLRTQQLADIKLLYCTD